MSRQQQCAHCEDERGGPMSLDYGRRVKCPACDQPVCPACRAQSTTTDCGSFADA
jgi:hypothetical protein